MIEGKQELLMALELLSIEVKDATRYEIVKLTGNSKKQRHMYNFLNKLFTNRLQKEHK